VERRSIPYSFIAVLVALNYFAFRAELFSDEYQSNHPDRTSGHSISGPTLNWETFDKDNATQAFVFDAEVRIESLFLLQCLLREDICHPLPLHHIRDKSPPQSSFFS
jgi:hypothetical protein